VVGKKDGSLEGFVVGSFEGLPDGVPLGGSLGREVGSALARRLGGWLGTILGLLLGTKDGLIVGGVVGLELGCVVGAKLGILVGRRLGLKLGTALGNTRGSVLGWALGSKLGLCVGLGLPTPTTVTPALAKILLEAFLKGTVYHSSCISPWLISMASSMKDITSVGSCSSRRSLRRCGSLATTSAKKIEGVHDTKPMFTSSSLADIKVSVRSLFVN
jgi:hypothetical protein